MKPIKPFYTPKIFKEQKSTLGYNYSAIKKRIRTTETKSGGSKLFIILRTYSGFNRDFDILQIEDDFIIMQSGLVQYKIVK